MVNKKSITSASEVVGAVTTTWVRRVSLTAVFCDLTWRRTAAHSCGSGDAARRRWTWGHTPRSSRPRRPSPSGRRPTAPAGQWPSSSRAGLERPPRTRCGGLCNKRTLFEFFFFFSTYNVVLSDWLRWRLLDINRWVFDSWRLPVTIFVLMNTFLCDKNM